MIATLFDIKCRKAGLRPDAAMEERRTANPTNQYDPDYAVPPGWVLEERLDVQGMSHAEFAAGADARPS